MARADPDLQGGLIGEPAFAAATAEVCEAIARLRGSAADGEPGSAADPVTQFEAAIAISFAAFRTAGVEVAVVEAGLGGRLDATNVISSEATALTSVALDHTDWLGATVAEIAAEKLAVLEPETTLVTGRLEPEIEAAARARAEVMGARFVHADAAGADAVPGRYGPYLRRNAGVALELVAAVAERPAPELSRAALEPLELGGRLQWIEGDAAAARRRRPQRRGGAGAGRGPGTAWPVRASPASRCSTDKDAAGDRRGARTGARRRGLHGGGSRPGDGPARAQPPSTRCGSPRALAPPGSRPRSSADPAAALRPRRGDRQGARRSGDLRRLQLPFAVRMDREARSELLSMMGLVAAVVAGVILVFFGLGYLFGLFFL